MANLGVITGRIFDIVIVNDKMAQIILKKKHKDKVSPLAINVFGYWKDKAINEMKLKARDKIKANVYARSNIWKGKYYTELVFEQIYLVEPAPVKFGKDTLFNENFSIDIETGEIKE